MIIAICILILVHAGTIVVMLTIWRHLEYGFNRMDRLEREIGKLWELQVAARDDGTAGGET